jgi:hypothetical protein
VAHVRSGKSSGFAKVSLQSSARTCLFFFLLFLSSLLFFIFHSFTL